MEKLLTSILLLLMTVGPACAQQGLKDALGKYFLVGVALNTYQSDGKDPRATQIVRQHFNSIVAEN